MPTFLSNCACEGIRPSGIVKTHYDSRPHVIGKLLKDRHIVRFLKAPNGFGKSTVAFEYASMMFSFKHVFWIKCDSPYFLRDLDANTMLSTLFELDGEVALVVFDDLPALNPERAHLFSELLDGLIERGCEVLTIVVPSFDLVSMHHRERIIVDAYDLMLTEDEIGIERLRGNCVRFIDRDVPFSERIPCLFWGDGSKGLVAELAKEALSSELWVALFVLLVLREGSATDLENYLSKQKCADALEYLSAHYPLLGIERRSHSFVTADLPIEEIAEQVGKRACKGVGVTLHASALDLIRCLATALVRRGECARACDVMRLLTSKAEQCSWLAREGWHMIECGHPYELLSMGKGLTSKDAYQRQTLSVLMAWALFALGEKKLAQKESAHALRMRVQNQFMYAAASALDHFLDTHSDISSESKDAQTWDAVNETGNELSEHPDWFMLCRLIARLHAAAQVRADALGDALRHLGSSSFPKSSETALCLYVRLAIMDLVEQKDALDNDHAQNIDHTDTKEARVRSSADGADEDAAYICSLIDALLILFDEDELGSSEVISWSKAELLLAIDRIYARLPEQLKDRISQSLVLKAKRTHIAFAEQSQLYRQMCMKEEAKKMEFIATHPDPFRNDPPTNLRLLKSASGILPLDIKLFGGLQVSIGNERVEPKVLSRKKSQIVLALLAINKGKEISRERLSEILWPQSDPYDCRNNFYSIWSQLKRALSIEGECPYLIRSQYGCSLDARYLHTDIERFESLCNRLLFAKPSPSEWQQIYTEINDSFSQELMPAEKNNAYIVAKRNTCTAQLVDGLVSASNRMLLQGEVQGALWFAREALMRCEIREDVYIALMQAQIAANQRSSALETYFKCREVLTDELGIDPSTKIVELYRSIIESEEMLI